MIVTHASADPFSWSARACRRSCSHGPAYCIRQAAGTCKGRRNRHDGGRRLFTFDGEAPTNDGIAQRLRDLGIELHGGVPPRHAYVPSTRLGGMLFLSGKTPKIDGVLQFEGRLGAELDVEAGVDAARIAAVNALSSLESEVGLERVERILKVTGYVASADGFSEQSAVINGASELFAAALEERGRHARTAIGVAYLPGNAPVELDLVVHVS